MKCIYALSVLLAIAAVNAEETYSTENDDLDIDAVVANLDTLKEFAGCFLETTTCNAVAADFKKDILIKRTQAHKVAFFKFLLGLKEKLPSDYEAFKKKFDPEGKHFTALEAAVATHYVTSDDGQFFKLTTNS